MRRKEREIAEMKAIMQVIDRCKVLRLGLMDGDIPYILPLNFGYTEQAGKLTFCFHTAKAGKKLDLIAKQPKVAFEMDCSHALVEGKIGCQYTYHYESVMGQGMVSIVEDVEEKKHLLSVLMRHQAGKEFTFTDAQAQTIAVLKLVVTSISAKASL